MSSLFQIRATGICIENNKILLVKQKHEDRNWSLPGGRLETGETLEQGVIREVWEETGLLTEVDKLLYVCDKLNCESQLVHITFLLKRVSGKLTLPTNEFDNNEISDVRFVDLTELTKYGFTEKFQNIVVNGFNNSGSYMGLKENIGL